MPAEKINIERFLELAHHHPVIDVRSPGEYKHAHIPGANSLPLFTDEERKIVGTAYKQQSREVAIKLGLDFFGPKMKTMVEEVENIYEVRSKNYENKESTNFVPPTSKIVLVYCWRGGMRSGAVSWLLDLYGFKVYTLVGGYKKFRSHVLETFKLPFHFNILGGYTGSGKTGLLKELKEKGEPVIDLEALAVHKGSAFGSIGLPSQPSQEMFENLLARELTSYTPLTTSHSPIWLEDESQRIGLVNIPPDLWKTMRRSPVYFLDIPFGERLKNIVSEYGPLDHEKVVEAITRISQKLGHLNAKTAILHLKQGEIGESFAILLKYYDKFYFKALHNREAVNSLLYTIERKSITPENADQLIAQRKAKSFHLQHQKN